MPAWSVNYTVGQAATLGLELPDWILKAVEWISFILIALTGSQTYQYLHHEEDNPKE